jgi:hypothetical protein
VPPLNTQLNAESNTHARSISDSGPMMHAMNARSTSDLHGTNVSSPAQQRVHDDYRSNSLTSLTTSPVTRPVSPASTLFGHGGASRKIPIVYPALLSRVADAFRMRITLQTHYKDSLEYKNSFNGRDAVVSSRWIILFIIYSITY